MFHWGSNKTHLTDELTLWRPAIALWRPAIDHWAPLPDVLLIRQVLLAGAKGLMVIAYHY